MPTAMPPSSAACWEKAIAARFGFAIDEVVRTPSEWKRHAAANPFAGDADALAKMVHLCLSRDPVQSNAAKDLEQKAQAGERIVLAGGALWIDYGPNGAGKSELTPLRSRWSAQRTLHRGPLGD